MDDLIENYENLKISAFNKLKQVNNSIQYVTLGPNSNFKKPVEPKQSAKIQTKNVVKGTPPIRAIQLMHPNIDLRKILIAKEMERIGKVQQAVVKRQNVMLERQTYFEKQSRSNWLVKQQELLQRVEDEETQIFKALEEHDKNSQLRNEQRRQYYQELEARRRRKDLEIQAKEKLKRDLQDIEKIKRNQGEIAMVYQDILNILRTNVIDQSIKGSIIEVSQDLKLVNAEIDEITHKCKTGIIQNEVQRSYELLQQIQYLRNKIQAIIDDYNKQKEAAIKQQPIEVKPILKDVIPTSQQNIVHEAKIDSITSKIDKFVSKSSFRYYSELETFLQNHDKSFEELNKDMSLKQFKFDCKKAVNIPVNAISAVNPQHLLDKYNKLSNLLSGKTVMVGDSQICATRHPQGIAFCMDLLAKKFILQADLMISSNPEAAFCYASMILTLWDEFPDFGKLLMAHFHKQCPYLVPIHLPKAIGQSDEEYYTSLGYQYNNGAIEKQDKFLKRMTGVMRLYSAIIISKPKKSHQKGMHLHGFTQGWRWLTATLNLEPKTDITATLLHVFLETVGYAMQNAYKNEFRKLLVYIVNVYMPMLKKIDSGGPYTRLEVLLQEYREKRHFEQPRGVLSNNYW